jgi:hypothetical protein
MLSEYELTELEEVPKDEWVDEVIKRYEEAGEELALPNFGEENIFPFFYHFMTRLETLAPYVSSDPDSGNVAAIVENIDQNGLNEPLRLLLTALAKGDHSEEGGAMLAAAEQLGLPQLPVRFSFTDCVLCENRSDSAHYTVDEMRIRNSIDWVKKRFFDEAEYVFVDKAYPGGFSFPYHLNPTVDEMLNEYFSGDPDDKLVDEWRDRYREGKVNSPLPAVFNYGAREVEFGDKRWKEEEIHAFLVALKDMNVDRYPVLGSFQDQITCRAGAQRTTFSENEMFPDGRVPIVARRFFEDNTRILYDEAGRWREAKDGYPFGKNYPYHMMTLVGELMSYVDEDDYPGEDEIEEKVDEIKDQGILRPVFLKLQKSNEKIELLKESIVTIVAANRLEMKKLPTKVLYTYSKNNSKNLCELMLEQLFKEHETGTPKGAHGGGWISPS